MIDSTRYQALVELVQEQQAMGLPPNPAWVAEIATYAPPPPPPPPPTVVFTTPPPPPPPVPPRAATSSKEPGARNVVEITNMIDDLTLKILASWGERFCVFQAGGKLLEVQVDCGAAEEKIVREREAPRTVVVKAARARTLASKTCNFFKTRKDKPPEENLLPPEWVGQALVTRVDFPNVPYLAGLVQAPTLRFDGAIIHERGYDKSTGIYLETDLKISVPENPSQRDAEEALFTLMDLLADFEFTSPVGRTVWLAALLSITCRHTFKGPAPMFIFDASKRGAGKSCLADMISIIATGQKAARMVYTHNDEEMDKRITSLGLASEQLVLLDNVVGKLGSPSLDAALTSDSYRARVLGKSEMTGAIPMKIIWIATGNGVIIGADTARRSLLARLEPSVEHPEARSGPRPGARWRHPKLLRFIEENRSKLLGAALTLVSAYIRAGRPPVNYSIDHSMGSFDEWNDVVRSSIIWAGGVDPCESISDVRAADLQELALETLVECWPVADNVEVPVATLIEKAQTFSDPNNTIKAQWRNALLDWLPPKGGAELPTARDLGYALRGVKDSIIGNYKIVAGKPTKSGIPWARIRVLGGDGQSITTNEAPHLVSV